MEKEIEALTTRRDELLNRQGELYAAMDGLECEAFKNAGRLPHWIAASFILLSFAIGLYTGHKIKRGAETKEQQTSNGLHYGTGYAIGYREGEMEGKKYGTVSLRITNSPTAEEYARLHVTDITYQPITLTDFPVLRTSKTYTPIQHTKGAERLRL